jgi:hypothetical protein
MSSILSTKLDVLTSPPDTSDMTATPRLPPRSRRVTGLVRQRIEQGGERLWRLEDFRDLPFAAVAQALSRLARSGVIERLSKGVYYRIRQTAFGKSRPNPTAIQKLAGRRKAVFPSGSLFDLSAKQFH